MKGWFVRGLVALIAFSAIAFLVKQSFFSIGFSVVKQDEARADNVELYESVEQSADVLPHDTSLFPETVRVAVYPFTEIGSGEVTGYGSLLSDLIAVRLGEKRGLTVLDRSPAYLVRQQSTHEDLVFSQLKQVADFVVSGRLLDLQPGPVLVVEAASASDGSLVGSIQVRFSEQEIDAAVEKAIDMISGVIDQNVDESAKPILRVAIAPFFPSPDANSIEGEMLPEILLQQLAGVDGVRLIQRINTVPLLVESVLSQIHGDNPDFFGAMSPSDLLIQGYYSGRNSDNSVRAVIFMTVGGRYTYSFSAVGRDWQDIAENVIFKVREQVRRRQRPAVAEEERRRAFDLFVNSIKDIGFNYTRPVFGQSLGFDPSRVGRAGAGHRCVTGSYEEVLKLDPSFDSARLALARCMILEGDDSISDEIVTHLFDVILNARYQRLVSSASVAAGMLGDFVRPIAPDGSDVRLPDGISRFEDYLPGSYYRGEGLAGLDRLLAYGQAVGRGIFVNAQPKGLPGEARWNYLMGRSVIRGKPPEDPRRKSCKTPTPWNVNEDYFRIVAIKSIDYHAVAAMLSYEYPAAFLDLARAARQFDVVPRQYAEIFYQYIAENYAGSDAAGKAAVEMVSENQNVLDECQQKYIHSEVGLWSRREADFISLYDASVQGERPERSALLIDSAVDNLMALCGYVERYRDFPRGAEDFSGRIMDSLTESQAGMAFKRLGDQAEKVCMFSHPYLVMSIASQNPAVASEQLSLLHRVSSGVYPVHPDFALPFSYEAGMRARLLEAVQGSSYSQFMEKFRQSMLQYPSGVIGLASVLGAAGREAQAISLLRSQGKGSMLVDYPCCGEDEIEYSIDSVTDEGKILYRSQEGMVLTFNFHPEWNVMILETDAGKYQSRRRWSLHDSFVRRKEKRISHTFGVTWTASAEDCDDVSGCVASSLLSGTDARVHSGLVDRPNDYATPLQAETVAGALAESQLRLRSTLWQVFGRSQMRREIAPSAAAVYDDLAVVGAIRARTLVAPDFRRRVREGRLAPDNLAAVFNRLFRAGYIDVYGRPTERYFEMRRSFSADAYRESEYWQSVVGGGYHPELMDIINALQASTEETGAAFIYRRKDGVWTFEEQIAPSDASNGTGFGVDVAIHENKVAVCAGPPGVVSGRGGVYVYTHSSSGWQELQKVWGDTCSGVAMTRDWLAVRTPTHVRLFRFVAGHYEPAQVLLRGADSVDPATDDLGPLELDQLGIAMDDQTLAVSSSAANYVVGHGHVSGVVYIYRLVEGRWVLSDAIMPPFEGAAGANAIRFGESLVVRDGVLGIGSPSYRTELREKGSGMVSLYIKRGEQGWQEVQRLRQDPSAGRPMEHDFGAGLELIDECLVIRARGGEYYAPLPSDVR